MIRIPDIVTALKPLVGWRQSYNPAEAINNELLMSESGLYYQDAHPLMTLNNITSVMPDDFKYQYPEWNMIKGYKVGDKVLYKGVVWICLVENTDEPPKEYNNFNDDYNEDYNDGDGEVIYWQKYN